MDDRFLTVAARLALELLACEGCGLLDEVEGFLDLVGLFEGVG